MGINDEKIAEQVAIEPTFKNNVTITLSAFDCHKLLRSLDNQLSISNRDTVDTTDVYEKIATQLSGKNFVINGSEKHRKLEPEHFKKLEQEELEKIMRENIKKNSEAYKKSVSWWGKLFGKA